VVDLRSLSVRGKRVAPDLVIFDCDGVLVDSEPISIAILVDIITAAGVPISGETAYERFLGKSMATTIEILRDDFDMIVTDEHLRLARAELQTRFRRELKAIPGIAETLQHLKMPRCVASSSQPERIRLSLEVTGLLELFEPHIYSATMVKRGKPFPDLFLHAAREMGAAPGRCVVVEDSPAGILAAKDAGMRAFAFTGGSHAGEGALQAAIEALEPDLIFGDMRLLPQLLSQTAAKAS
jgi:HAD superfamily hydrolase (TIGR01509 family)